MNRSPSVNPVNTVNNVPAVDGAASPSPLPPFPPSPPPPQAAAIRCPNCRRWLLRAAPPIAHVDIRCPNCRRQVTIQGRDTLTATTPDGATYTQQRPGQSRA